MILRRAITIAAVAAAIAAGVGAYRLHALRASVDVGSVIANAMARRTSCNYVADIVTTVRSNGKPVNTKATLMSLGSVQKIEYKSASSKAGWSLSKGNDRYTYVPDQRSILVSEGGQILSEQTRTRLLLSSYYGRLDSVDEVAGRGVYVISLLPKQDGRPSKKLWIDKGRHTILKSVDYGSSGDERGSMETKKIVYNAPINSSRLTVPSENAIKRVMVCKSVDLPQLRNAFAFRVTEPSYIPDGYRLEGYHIYNSQCKCGHKSALITYTDGLNIISVFETPRMGPACAKACEMEKKGDDHGACTVQGCEMAKTGQVVLQDKTVVVVGDLLPKEITRIAESVK